MHHTIILFRRQVENTQQKEHKGTRCYGWSVNDWRLIREASLVEPFATLASSRADESEIFLNATLTTLARAIFILERFREPTRLSGRFAKAFRIILLIIIAGTSERTRGSTGTAINAVTRLISYYEGPYPRKDDSHPIKSILNVREELLIEYKEEKSHCSKAYQLKNCRREYQSITRRDNLVGTPWNGSILPIEFNRSWHSELYIKFWLVEHILGSTR